MKTAKELHELYSKAIEEEIKREQTVALEILENEVAPIMEATARRGEHHIIYVASSIIAAQAMETKLKELDYEVIRKNAKIDILWV